MNTDGIINDDFLVEIKCPFAVRDTFPNKGFVIFSFIHKIGQKYK